MRWVKRVAEWNDNSKWRKETERILKYNKIKWKKENGILKINDKRIDTWNQGAREIEKAVKLKGQEQGKKNMEEKKTLRYYKEKKKPSPVQDYDGGWAGNLLFRARTDTLELNTKKWKRDRTQGYNCRMCDRYNLNSETLEHMLVECNGYERERAKLNERMEGIIGVQKWNESKQHEDKGIQTLLCVNESKEKESIVREVKMFLKDVWKRRESGRRNIVTHVEHNYINNNVPHG